MKPRGILFLAILLAALEVPAPSDASVWVPAKKKGQAAFTFTYYETKELFDSRGTTYKMASNGVFVKHEVNAYLEYGLGSNFSVCLNLFAVTQQFKSDTVAQTYSGAGDQEMCLKYLILASPVNFGVQAGVKVPAYDLAFADPAPGNGQFDYELRLMLGNPILSSGFWDLEAAYRYRDGYPADEVRIDATVGAGFFARFKVLLQFNGISGMRNGQVYSRGNNPTIDPEYDLYKGGVSFVYDVSQKSSLQIGGIRHFSGTNTGARGSFFLSLWRRF
ncbi:MAG: hypothetical protein HZA04_04075 [Nitrospinae bacterium]|nr:hypothetical protein [Nitrospinota bacterium]